MWLLPVGLAVAATPGTTAPPEEACAPLDEAELRTLVLDAQSGIDRGDLELTAQIVGEVDERVPCLTFVVAPRTWADLLVARSIVAFSQHGDWQSAMASALRIRPAVDRGVGPSHPLYAWEPPPPPPGGAPVPAGSHLYVDGSVSPVLPPDDGVYLVQKSDGKYVNSRLLKNETLPMDWVRDPVERPPRIAAWGRLGLAVGGASAVQDARWQSDVYPDLAPAGVAFGATGDLQMTFFSPFGLLAHGYVGWFDAPTVDGRVSAIWTHHAWTVGGGVGRLTVPVAEWLYDTTPRVMDRRVEVLQYGDVTGMVRSHGELGYDVGLTVGLGPAAILSELTFGLLLPELGGQRYRIGFWMDRRDGAFVEQGFPDRALAVSAGTLSISLELVRGEEP